MSWQESNVRMEHGQKYGQSRLVQVRDEFEDHPVLGTIDPKPLEEVIRDVICAFRQSNGYDQVDKRRYAVEVLSAFHARIVAARYPEKIKRRGVSDEDYRDIINLCVEHLLHCDCPAQETIQLQVTVHTSLHRSTNNYITTKNKNGETLDVILGLICDCQAVDNRKLYEAVEYLHGRMVDYLLELNRQIDQQYMDSNKEILESDVVAALESVLPKKGLLYWMDLSKEEKISQMEELADVVVGIQVFNKCMKRGGEHFTLPYEYFEIESQELRQKAQETLQLVNSRVENSLLGIREHVDEYGYGHIFITRLRDELIYFMQAAVFLQSLDFFVAERLKVVSNVSESCAECIDKICAVIGDRNCIAAELVYPELRKVGQYQRSTLEEYNLLRAHSEAAIPLFVLSETPTFVLAPMGRRRLEIKAKNFLFFPREMEWTDVADSIIEYGGQQRATLVDDSLVEHNKSRLEYCGFCPVSLVRRNGMLIRGDIKLGLVQVGDKVYALAEEDFIGRFLRSPQMYLRGVHNILLKMPQIIHLLGLHNDRAFSYVSIPKILTQIRDPFPRDFGAQTCTHALPYHTWDRETLEKRIQELRNMKTTSSQTKDSHFHRHNDAQVWPPKDKWSQTPTSRGTTMAHHVRILHNLRGDVHETPKIIKATFEVDNNLNPFHVDGQANSIVKFN